MEDILNEIDQDISLCLDNLPVGILRFNNNKECIYANKYIMDLLNFDYKDLQNIHQYFKENIHKDDYLNEMNKCDNFLNNFQESQSSFRLFDVVNKSYKWMINKRIIMRRKDSKKISYLYTLQDIDAMKEIELKLKEETIRAEQAYAHKSIFLANMSHEIRTPLNGIVGMLTLLEDTNISKEQQDYIEMINECSFNLMTIINDILDYSKLEVGKIELNAKPFSIPKCIESTNDIILSKVIEKTLDFSYIIDPLIPSYVEGDPDRLKQILLNLLSNSIKFTDKGNIKLIIKQISKSEFYSLKEEKCDDVIDSVYIRFDIEDSGCGILEGQKNKLFKSFSQVDNINTSKVYQGTGLGLAICRELVTLMGGCIWLDKSIPHEITRFSFVIKAKKDNNIHITQRHDNTSLHILRDMNVLIIDDNMYNRISLTGMVTKWGMKAYSFSTPKEALYYAKIVKFDIGLIDICMPKLDGIGFANKLREQQNIFPLIALSSLGDKFKINSTLFLNHLIKPVKETKLQQICINVLKTNNTIVKYQQRDVDTCQHTHPVIYNNIRIIIAEDVFINQKVIVNFLKKIGFTIMDVVENGQQCIDYLKQNKYDIVLLDIRMPILNGVQVFEYISEKLSYTPYVIAVTAYSQKEDREKYLKLGFNDYIPKPISYNTLKQCIDKFINHCLNS
jgi:signal transduction histidine kinase/DNA-binding response OmpR family regulator